MVASRKHHGQSHKWVKRQRLDAMIRQGNRCYWCKEFMTMPQSGDEQRPTDATLEHLVPIADGGSKKAKNVVAACMKCNTARPTERMLKHNARQQAEAAARRASKEQGL